MSKRLILPLLSILIVVSGTVLAITLAKGYRPNLKTGSLQGTGLLVANSFPSGAQVFINNKLATATDTTLNLSPGTYAVEIRKDGYTSWQKTLVLTQELVTQTNATLFPIVPNLTPLTFTSAHTPALSPDGHKLAFIADNSATPAKNGLYVLDLGTTPLLRDPSPRQISRIFWTRNDSPRLAWNPNSQELLISFDNQHFLINASRLNDSPTNISSQLTLILDQWLQELTQVETTKFKKLPESLQPLAREAFINLYFSPDTNKLLYTASKAISLPEKIIPDLPSESTQKEERELEPGAFYVYDLKEDKNFRLAPPLPAELGEPKVRLDLTATTSAQLTSPEPITPLYSPLSLQNIQWFPDSSHLIMTETNKIILIESDSTNPAVVFANTFAGNFVFPSPDGSQLFLFTNLNQNAPVNLYSLSLK